MRPAIISFEQAQDHIIKEVLHAEQKPYLVLLMGDPNSGKSTLARRCRESLYNNHQLIGINQISGDNPDDVVFKYARDFMIIEDVFPCGNINSYLQRLFSRDLDLTLFLTSSVSAITEGEWNYLTRRENLFFTNLGYIVENSNARIKRV